MSEALVTIKARTVRHIAVATDRPYDEFRTAYEAAVPSFDRLEAIGVVKSGAGWAAIEGLSVTALLGKLGDLSGALVGFDATVLDAAEGYVDQR